MKTILKITALSAVLLMLAIPLFAQADTSDYVKPPLVTADSTFQLSSFQLPEFRRRALTTSYGLSNQFRSNNNYQRWQYHYETQPDTEEREKRVANYFSLKGNVYFSDIHYTRKHQKETYISSNIKFDTEYQKNRIAEPSVISNKFNIDPDISFRQINRRYLSENLFVGYSPSIAYGFSARRERAKQKEIYDNKTNQFSQNLTAQISLEIGLGRIEPIGDARHAIYIFDALARRGVISVAKTSDDIIRFAEFIAELKNKRYLDARHRKIYEMEALDSFLLANGHRDTLSMAYFTTLEDFWIHGNINRGSGKRWAFYTAPGYDFQSTKTKSFQDGETTQNSYYDDQILNTRFGISFTYEKPINLFWQNSFSSSLEYRQQNIRLMQKNNLDDDKQTRFGFRPHLVYLLSHYISYFPTTRTSASFGYGLSYDFLQEPHLFRWNDITYHSLGANIQAGASYFFSPQLQLNLQTRLNYYHRDDYRLYNNHFLIADTKSRQSSFQFYVGLSLDYIFY